jgi:hypothetical protein
MLEKKCGTWQKICDNLEVFTFYFLNLIFNTLFQLTISSIVSGLKNEIKLLYENPTTGRSNIKFVIGQYIRYISLVLFSFLWWMGMSLHGTSATIWPVIPAPDGTLLVGSIM